MMRLNIKPLSVNAAYRGRRFATKDLVEYKKALGYLLPRMVVPEGKLVVRYTFGISAATDGDNCIKAFQDAIAKKYGFNDNRIYEWYIKKVQVKKNKEFIEFEVKKVIHS